MVILYIYIIKKLILKWQVVQIVHRFYISISSYHIDIYIYIYIYIERERERERERKREREVRKRCFE